MNDTHVKLQSSSQHQSKYFSDVLESFQVYDQLQQDEMCQQFEPPFQTLF